jgi:hypothetical protein
MQIMYRQGLEAMSHHINSSVRTLHCDMNIASNYTRSFMRWMRHVARMRQMKTSNFYNVFVEKHREIIWEIKAQKGSIRLKLSLCLIN